MRFAPAAPIKAYGRRFTDSRMIALLEALTVLFKDQIDLFEFPVIGDVCRDIARVGEAAGRVFVDNFAVAFQLRADEFPDSDMDVFVLFHRKNLIII